MGHHTGILRGQVGTLRPRGSSASLWLSLGGKPSPQPPALTSAFTWSCLENSLLSSRCEFPEPAMISLQERLKTRLCICLCRKQLYKFWVFKLCPLVSPTFLLWTSLLQRQVSGVHGVLGGSRSCNFLLLIICTADTLIPITQTRNLKCWCKTPARTTGRSRNLRPRVCDHKLTGVAASRPFFQGNGVWGWGQAWGGTEGQRLRSRA